MEVTLANQLEVCSFPSRVLSIEQVTIMTIVIVIIIVIAILIIIVVILIVIVIIIIRLCLWWQ